MIDTVWHIEQRREHGLRGWKTFTAVDDLLVDGGDNFERCLALVARWYADNPSLRGTFRLKNYRTGAIVMLP